MNVSRFKGIRGKCRVSRNAVRVLLADDLVSLLPEPCQSCSNAVRLPAGRLLKLHDGCAARAAKKSMDLVGFGRFSGHFCLLFGHPRDCACSHCPRPGQTRSRFRAGGGWRLFLAPWPPPHDQHSCLLGQRSPVVSGVNDREIRRILGPARPTRNQSQTMVSAVR